MSDPSDHPLLPPDWLEGYLPSLVPSPQVPARSGFSDGGRVALEMPGIQHPRQLEAFLEAAQARRIPPPHRVLETKGMGRLPLSRIQEFAELARSHQVGLVASIRPRAKNDLGSYARSPQGGRAELRLRGQRGLRAGLTEALRLVEAGIRGLLVYDEGLLMLLSQLIQKGRLPQDLQLKASIAMGVSNPLHARQIQTLGATSLNPVNDLPAAMLSELRKALSIPLDVHLDDSKEAGGIDRLSEIRSLVLSAAPVFLKFGRAADSDRAEDQVDRLERVQEALSDQGLESLLVGRTAIELALPEEAGAWRPEKASGAEDFPA